MPVFLGEYKNAATNRPEKFIRAVKSFLSDCFTNKELIIVSDGCDESQDIYRAQFKKHSNITFIKLNKQSSFCGIVRQTGLEVAKGDCIAYLDADDTIQPSHLSNVINGFRTFNYDWLYYNDYVRTGKGKSEVRPVSLSHAKIGTSSISHSRSLNVSWEGCNGYGHDWTFVQKLMAASKNHGKIMGCGYMVCHIPKLIDF